jgi:hypothetical protein
MEDNLKIKWKTTSEKYKMGDNVKKMEDDLKKNKKMEDNLKKYNERRTNPKST